MSASKASVAARLHIRRGLGAAEAALYIGIGVTKFESLVNEGRMPRPKVLDSRRIWDVDDLDAAFKALPYEGETVPEENSWDYLLQVADAALDELQGAGAAPVANAREARRIQEREVGGLMEAVSKIEGKAILHRGYLMSEADFREEVLAKPMGKLERKALLALHAHGGGVIRDEAKGASGKTQDMLELRGYVSIARDGDRFISWRLTDAGIDATKVLLAVDGLEPGGQQ